MWWHPTVGSFMLHLGCTDSMRAESWAVLWGLKRAWDKGIRHIIVETDCFYLVERLTDTEDVEEEGELSREITVVGLGC